MDLLGISEREYRTYIEVGLLKPISQSSGQRHLFLREIVASDFQLTKKTNQ